MGYVARNALVFLPTHDRKATQKGNIPLMDTSADSLLGKMICENTSQELLGHETVIGVNQSRTYKTWQGKEPPHLPAERQTDNIPVLNTLLMTPETQEQIHPATTPPAMPSLDLPLTRETVKSDPQDRSTFRKQKQEDEQKQVGKGSKLIASSEMHVKIATMATHIQQMKERLQAQSKELRPVNTPYTSENHSENHVEEDPFPAWLN